MLRRKLNRRTMSHLRLPTVLLGMLLAAAYFVSHVVFGTHGLLAKGRLLERSIEIEREVVVLEAVRSRLRQDIAALATDPPAPGIVEEIARSVLGYVREGDLVVANRRRTAAAQTVSRAPH